MIIFMCFKLFSIYPAKKLLLFSIYNIKKNLLKFIYHCHAINSGITIFFLINKYAEFSFSEKNKQILKRFGGKKEHH